MLNSESSGRDSFSIQMNWGNEYDLSEFDRLNHKSNLSQLNHVSLTNPIYMNEDSNYNSEIFNHDTQNFILNRVSFVCHASSILIN